MSLPKGYGYGGRAGATEGDVTESSIKSLIRPLIVFVVLPIIFIIFSDYIPLMGFSI
jgi:hypothetical protein